MQIEPATDHRNARTEQLDTDLVVIGGGIAGVCAALTAARAGIKVVLVQDRPVLGGNASSEVRLWVLGATAHMQNNNRWAREGGVLDELLVENIWRNPEGNPLIFDTILLEKVSEEKRISLLLNTVVYEVHKSTSDTIERVTAFNSQNSTRYIISAPLVCDASGDGHVAFLAGAAFRMGAETRDEFGEKFAPHADYGELLGHSLYFYSKDTGKPVRFIAPSFALKDITQIPRYRSFNAQEYGCRLWWIEYGGRLDTVHDTERIKWELWRVVYGVWDYIKNSGKFPDADTLTLEWVGHFPGKRESRRFEGTSMLTQQDIIEQRQHADAVSFGGWSIDLHPADGIFSERPGCNQWHSRGVYQIPYGCLHSKTIRNLFLAGRIISVSHVAFGSTRVMGTCGSAAQAVGMAAALCIQHGISPEQAGSQQWMPVLQRNLLRSGQYIPGVALHDPDDLAANATISASSEYVLRELPDDGDSVQLTHSWAQMLPIGAGKAPQVTFTLDVTESTELELQLRVSSHAGGFTPDTMLASRKVSLRPGNGQHITDSLDVQVDEAQYLYYVLIKNPNVAVHTSTQHITGLLALRHAHDQIPDGDIGIEQLEMWLPRRRPASQNLAIVVEPACAVYMAANTINGYARPTTMPNAWLAEQRDTRPTLNLHWDESQRIREIVIEFDTDFDHPIESVLMGHPESAMPHCVSDYRILDGAGQVVAAVQGNHQSIQRHILPEPLVTDTLRMEITGKHGNAPAAIFGVHCYA